MQEQSLTTSHQQVHAQPLSEQKTPWKLSAHLSSSSSSALGFIVELDVMWYGKDLWTVGSAVQIFWSSPAYSLHGQSGEKKETLAIEQAVFSNTQNTVVLF